MADGEVAEGPGPPQNSEYLKGRGAFTEPGAMIVGRWYPLQFLVGPTEQAIADEAGGLQLAPSQTVYVGAIMRVTLLPDPNFEARKTTPAVQRTGADRSASWQWSVMPLRDGNQVLHARVEVLTLDANGSYTTVESKARHVSIKVKVGTWQGFMNALRRAASLSDVLTTLFGSWGKALTALAALIGTIFGVPLAIRAGMKRLRSQGQGAD